MVSLVVLVLMQKLVIGMQNNYGFSLIEILIVIFIIGISLGFAMLAFGDFGSSRRIMMASEQFINYVKFVEQQAVFESTTLGIGFDHNDYRVLRFNTSKGWQVLAQKNIFNAQHFPRDALIHLSSSSGQKSPQIIIDSSGNISPFRLNIDTLAKVHVVQVIGEYNGDINLK